MHPSELKNQALVAAVQARFFGFNATADAFTRLAAACADENFDLQERSSLKTESRMETEIVTGSRAFEVHN